MNDLHKTKPTVVIIGRPNVGKSTLFNKLVGRKISITESTPGVTRDRIFADAEWLNYKFNLVDTSGLEDNFINNTSDKIKRDAAKQTINILSKAELILFLVDAREGLLTLDYDIANFIRKKNKNILLVINKVDDFSRNKYVYSEFFSLGISDDPILISAENKTGIGDLLDEIINRLKKNNFISEELNYESKLKDEIKIAVIGKPNVGKSSFVNKIVGYERVIVNDSPGTTRDAIDVVLEKDQQKYILIDTAGIRKKSRVRKAHENIEYYSIVRAIDSIERADVCVLLIDATKEITEQDVKIAGVAHEKYKPVIIAVNKWDLIKEKNNNTIKDFLSKINFELKYMSYAQKIFISVLTGQRLNKLFDLIKIAWENNNLRIKTSELNQVIINAITNKPPMINNGKRFRIFYATQVSVRPPTFVLFVNNQELLHFSYKRYLENRIRDAYGFIGTPIKIIFRDKVKKK